MLLSGTRIGIIYAKLFYLQIYFEPSERSAIALHVGSLVSSC